MPQPKTFGRFPTLREMKTYYNRDDVLNALFHQCQQRSVTIALCGEHTSIRPTSVTHLRDIINETIRTQIEPKFDGDSDCSVNLHVPVEVFWSLENIDVETLPPPGYTFLWHGTTADRVNAIQEHGFRLQGEGQGVFFSPKFRLSCDMAEMRAKQRDEPPVIFRCLFDDEQLARLEKRGKTERVFHTSYYLSLHANLTIAEGQTVKGFDLVLESDNVDWRRCFESLLGPIRMLDDFGVFYQLKYSGARSLHLMIPFEVFPDLFNRTKVVEQWDEIYQKIRAYFFNRCRMGWIDRPKVLRLAYSLNEDNGLVSVPLDSAELDDFRPWQANLYQPEIGRSWYSDIPTGAVEKTQHFLDEIFAEKKAWKAIGTSHYDDRQLRFSTWRGNDVWTNQSSDQTGAEPLAAREDSESKWVEKLNSPDAKVRVEAAWHLMHANTTVPLAAVKAGLVDTNTDVQWYLAEAMNRTRNDETIRLAGKMVFNADSFVSVSAADLLIHAGRLTSSNLIPFWDGAFAFLGGLGLHTFRSFVALIEQMHATRTQADWQAFAAYGIEKIARHLPTLIEQGTPYETTQSYLNLLNRLCAPAQFESAPAYLAMRAALIPDLLHYLAKEEADLGYVWMLQRFWPKEALLIETVRQCAKLLDTAVADLSATQASPEATEHFRSLVTTGLTDLTRKQIAHLLTALVHACSVRLIPALVRLLSHHDSVDVIAVMTPITERRRGKQRQKIRRIVTQTLGDIEEVGSQYG